MCTKRIKLSACLLKSETKKRKKEKKTHPHNINIKDDMIKETERKY